MANGVGEADRLVDKGFQRALLVVLAFTLGLMAALTVPAYILRGRKDLGKSSRP
ncbi:hypothetical protein [Cerasicoccus arenae]|uniref:Uncharacterized protein n=1 Tax=Cerasicoccus arenae TaxID=424488 RepID=A0A8J3DFS3_9BACT|nr:hypothetical protein [Cerasicoccus arenae]MBK1859024.1 hypothetical protein [Cerasicoccus arenae]GHB94784.1 hypothetical protein GCM10007047_07900 [Cerasicoccus arenae]